MSQKCSQNTAVCAASLWISVRHVSPRRAFAREPPRRPVMASGEASERLMR